jgi:hypothetical protein
VRRRQSEATGAARTRPGLLFGLTEPALDLFAVLRAAKFAGAGMSVGSKQWSTERAPDRDTSDRSDRVK